MHPEALVGGAVLLTGSPALLAWRAAVTRKIHEIAGRPTTAVRDLLALHEGVVRELGAGRFSDATSIEGIARSDTPLTTPYGGRPAISYHAETAREYEEQREVTEADGRRRTETSRGSETVERLDGRVPFVVDDGSGRVAVDPEGADVDERERFEDFQPEGPAMVFGGGRRTLGYRRTERYLGPGARVYVLGRATDEGGPLTLRRFEHGGGHFIISTASRADLLQRYRRTASVLKGIAVGLAPAGLALVVAGVR